VTQNYTNVQRLRMLADEFEAERAIEKDRLAALMRIAEAVQMGWSDPKALSLEVVRRLKQMR
jgi:spore coat polysaccharide biosynthesis predicted glycosyltransferase SpsG